MSISSPRHFFRARPAWWRTSLFCLTLGASSAAVAHTPGTLTEVVELDTVAQSWALYGEIETADDIYVIHLDLEEGIAIPIELLVPVEDELAGYRPWFAVVGPGLAPPTSEELALLPFEVPEGAGVYVERNLDEERTEYFEPFSQTNFWTTRAVALALDAGEHEIWVFSPDGTDGPFTLGLGVEEAWGPGDVLGLITGENAPKPVEPDAP